MTHILLTGAGFSRNWGGWLANEAFEYLLGSPEIDDALRYKLWQDKLLGGGFEDTLAAIQDEYNLKKNAESERRLNALTSALVGMFNEMGLAFAQKQFEPQNDVKYLVKTFLSRFDAIFTLNQDTLLEQHYVDFIVGGRWSGCFLPGLKPLGVSHIQGHILDRIAAKQPDPDNFRLHPNLQPYFKLHGSCNWSAGQSGGRVLVMGGQKIISINQFPILTWYHKQFSEHLSRPGTRLMIIGYSFGDKHINDAIGNAVDSSALKLFIIDPLGVDVLDKQNPRTVLKIPDPYREKLSPHLIGASRRPLTAIFGDDVVEHAKVSKFFV